MAKCYPSGVKIEFDELNDLYLHYTEPDEINQEEEKEENKEQI